jgi:hypothetical protein
MTFKSFAERMRLIWQVLRMPPTRLDMWGGAEARRVFSSCIRTRGRMPLLRKMTFGMALLAVPESPQEPFSGPSFKNLRSRHRRAQKMGYTFAVFDGPAQLEAVLAIHNSAPARQDIPMAAAYGDAAKVESYLKFAKSLYGVFDPQGVLRAYCHWPVAGDVAITQRIMGDHQLLRDGIMYFLILEMALHFARERKSAGHPRWMGYGSYLAGRTQMRVFKKECGFRPHRVICEWVEQTLVGYLH